MTSHEQLKALSPLECVLLPSEIANIAHVSRHHNYHVTFSVHLVHVACPPGVRSRPMGASRAGRRAVLRLYGQRLLREWKERHLIKQVVV